VVLATGFAVLTSRCSHDLVIKASRTGIAALVTLGLPTDLAVQSAQRLALPLFCFQYDQLKQFA
jgi:FdhD protein